jgi:hypothetical protein
MSEFIMTPYQAAKMQAKQDDGEFEETISGTSDGGAPYWGGGDDGKKERTVALRLQPETYRR